MKDFLVHLYIEEHCFTDTLSALYERSKDLVLSVREVSYRLFLPVFVEDGQFVIEERKQAKLLIGDQPVKSRRVMHGDLITVILENGTSYHLLMQSLQNFPLHTRICRPGQRVTFGRSEDNDVICSINHYAARHLAILTREGDQWVLCADGFGVTHGQRLLEKGERVALRPMDAFSCMGVQCLLLEGDLLSISQNSICHLEAVGRSYVQPHVAPGEVFARYPRIYASLHDGCVKIDAPTPLPQQRKMPLLLQVGPSITMAIAMIATIMISLQNTQQISSMYSSIVMAAAMLISALLWPILSRRYEQKHYEQQVAKRKGTYLSYIQDQDNRIARLYQENQKTWNERLFPSLSDCLKRLRTTKRELWVRNQNDQDFLSVRLGVGKRPFEVEIRIPQEAFSLEDDELKKMPEMLREKYQTLRGVPVVLSLQEHSVVGVVGDGAHLYPMADQLLSQLVYHYSPRDLKLVIIGRDASLFRWLLNVPHMWSADRRLRFRACDKQEVREIFEWIEQEIAQRQEQETEDAAHYVFVISDLDLIEGESLDRYLLQEHNDVNFHSIILSERFSDLPNATTAIVQYDASLSSKQKYGLYEKNKNNNILQLFESDPFDPSQLQELMAEIDRCDLVGTGEDAAIPQRIQFLEMFEVGHAEELSIASNWQRNSSHQSLAVPIGVNQKGELFYLDLHEKYHGCHGLVAGTTGSGKSEFLQSLLLSLMIHFSSDEVSFVLIDFKGGDMARPFRDTPHLSATISNLSTSILYRAEVSLEAEIHRRQTIFNQAASELEMDKIDINVYHRLYKEGKLQEPLPHLVILIDEFAQLKSQCEPFMNKLIDIAQVGRSLGIHLILATQKPSGVVDPQILSNSRFKVCLKVSDKDDSMDVIHRPDAAYIQQPGRACIQIGYDEINDVVQTGFAGAPYVRREHFVRDREISAYMISHCAQEQREYRRPIKEEKTKMTQIEAVIRCIRTLADKHGYHSHPLWLLPLTKVLGSDTLEEAEGDGRILVPMGRIDDIWAQRQSVLSLSLQGNIAVYGSGGSGKSTWIQTLLFQLSTRYAPKQLQYAMIDMSTRSFGYLKRDPHCRMIAFGDESASIQELFAELGEEIDRRKALFAQANVSTYDAYMQSGQTLPFVVIVIENYALFRENCYAYEEKLIEMLASADNYGMCFVLTANSSNAIHYKVNNHIAQRYVLYMNDPGDYQILLNARAPFELERIAGRGFLVQERRVMEFQTAIAFGESREDRRVERIMERLAAEPDEPERVQAPVPDVRSMEHPLFQGTCVLAQAKGRSCGFDLTLGNALICAAQLCRPLAEKLIREHEEIRAIDPLHALMADEARTIRNADAFSALLQQMRTTTQTYTLLIYSFHHFYRMLKNEDVFPFAELLEDRTRIRVITVETIPMVERYYSLPEPLHKKLMHVPQGLIVGIAPDMKLCGVLNDELHRSLDKMRMTGEAEGWLYLNEQCMKVHLEEVTGDAGN